MTEAEIKAIVDKLADIPGVLHNADPEDKERSSSFQQLGLKLTYSPGRRPVQANVEPVQCGSFDRQTDRQDPRGT